MLQYRRRLFFASWTTAAEFAQQATLHASAQCGDITADVDCLFIDVYCSDFAQIRRVYDIYNKFTE